MTKDVTVQQETETVCIKTEKVYDFCFKNGTHIFTISGLTVPVDTAGVDCILIDVDPTDNSLVKCEELTNKRIREAGGFAVVFLRKTATFDLVFLAADGTELGRVRRSRFIDEVVEICAPEGTDVQCEIRGELGRVLGFTTSTVDIAIDLCQLIQSKAEVKLCIETLGFCVPQICTQVEGKPFDCPPEPLFPEQCEGVTPTCQLPNS